MNKSVAIMQPYFLPYIGYYQLINTVDEFVIYDNIQYTKKGWINRNRLLCAGRDELITLPLRRGSDYADVCDRYLADDWNITKDKLLSKVLTWYSKAPYKLETLDVLDKIFDYSNKNLFEFIYNSLRVTLDYLDIKTKIVVSSTIQMDHSLKSVDKVLAICKAIHASHYVNPIGGVDLYSKEVFRQHNIHLQFLKANNIQYDQLTQQFVPYLSILDVLMFNSQQTIKEQYLTQYTLI